jgi:hypothetical protein
MQQLKIISKKEDKKEDKDGPIVMSGQVCPLPGKGSIGSAKGAMGSAVVTIIL